MPRSLHRRPCILLLLALATLAAGLLPPTHTLAFINGQAASLVLGQSNFTSSVREKGASLGASADVAVDPTSGAVFVSDFTRSRVLRFDSITSLTEGALADGVLGQPDFTSTISATTATGMYYPEGLAVDNQGRLWVADRAHRRVLRFDNAARKPNGAPADGVLGQRDFTSTDAPEPIALGLPSRLAVDESGHLWVAGLLARNVLRFDNAASKPNGAPADGVLTANLPGDSASVAHAVNGVAVDTRGTLWVADIASRVLRFDNAASKPDRAAPDGVLGQPDFTSSEAHLSAEGMDFPQDLAVDAEGRLWVVDRGYRRVLRFDNAAGKPNGAPADGVLGQPDFTSAASLDPASGGMSLPYGITVDASGRLWLAEFNGRGVRRFDNAAGKPNGAPADGTLGGRGIATLSAPQAVAVDPSTGKVFVADTASNRVLRFATAASLTSGALAEAVLGQSGFNYVGPTGALTGMAAPRGVAVDADGRLWVADTDNNRVLRFDNAAGKPNGAPADGLLDRSASAGLAMSRPSGVAVDAEGHLWVADTDNNRVLRFDNAASKPNSAPADAVLGQPDLIGDDPFFPHPIGSPAAVAVDPVGRLWVSDSRAERVLRFDNAASKANGAPADGVLSRPASDGPLAWAPRGLATDTTGRLWVADTNNNRVLRFDNAASKPGGAPADAVLGQPTPTSTGAATTAEGMSVPAGLTVDRQGRLWVADSGNNRVLRFEDLTLVRIPEQGGASGQTVRVPVLVDQPVSGLLSASLTIAFDPLVLRPHGAVAHPGALTPGWVVAANSTSPGLISLALISPGAPASGSGSLAELEFEVLGGPGSSSALQLGQVSLNDGGIPASTQDGRLTVGAPHQQLAVRVVNATTLDPLPNTSVQTSGPTSSSCLTDAAGSCALSLPRGTYTLALSKTDEVAGISAYDASLILQHVIGARVLSGPAFSAGDTDGNGRVTAFDAALVLQYVAGLRHLPFPAGKVWIFTPPSLPPLDQDRQVTVPGVLVGDVSGHLPPAAQGLRGASGAVGAIQLVQRGQPDAAGFRTVELWLSPAGEGLLSLSATLQVDQAQVTQLQLKADPSTGALLAAQATGEGQVRLALASGVPLPAGRVLTLRFRSDGLEGITLAQAETNEGGQPTWMAPTAQGWLLHLPLVQRRS